jgi:hypothetical protein
VNQESNAGNDQEKYCRKLIDLEFKRNMQFGYIDKIEIRNILSSEAFAGNRKKYPGTEAKGNKNYEASDETRY